MLLGQTERAGCLSPLSVGVNVRLWRRAVGFESQPSNGKGMTAGLVPSHAGIVTFMYDGISWAQGLLIGILDVLASSLALGVRGSV